MEAEAMRMYLSTSDDRLCTVTLPHLCARSTVNGSLEATSKARNT